MQTLEDFAAATTNGRIFTATFVKRTTGETRVMNCRVGVKSKLAGGEMAYDPAAHKLLPVYDLQAQGYRQISLDSLICVKLGGHVYNWKGDVFEQID